VNLYDAKVGVEALVADELSGMRELELRRHIHLIHFGGMEANWYRVIFPAQG